MRELAGYTPFMAMKAMNKELQKLFKGKTFGGPKGRRDIRFFEMDLPIPTGEDRDADAGEACSPFIITEMVGGAVEGYMEPQLLQMVLTVCCYDNGIERQGKLDVINIIEDIVQHFCAYNGFGGMFTVLLPIDWALQQDDTSPYYFGNVQLICTSPRMNAEGNPEVEVMV